MPHPSLLACPSCSRHIRSTERVCPFCRSAPPPSVVGGPVPTLPRRRLSRAALAFGASTLAVATLSCGGTSGGVLDDEAGLTDGAGDDANDAANDAAPDAHCLSGALYGGPAEPCPVERDGASQPDASAEDGGNPNPPSDGGLPPNYCDVISHAAYGAPPPECQ